MDPRSPEALKRSRFSRHTFTSSINFIHKSAYSQTRKAQASRNVYLEQPRRQNQENPYLHIQENLYFSIQENFHLQSQGNLYTQFIVQKNFYLQTEIASRASTRG